MLKNIMIFSKYSLLLNQSVSILQVQVVQLMQIHSATSSHRLKIRYSLEYFEIIEQTSGY